MATIAASKKSAPVAIVAPAPAVKVKPNKKSKLDKAFGSVTAALRSIGNVQRITQKWGKPELREDTEGAIENIKCVLDSLQNLAAAGFVPPSGGSGPRIAPQPGAHVWLRAKQLREYSEAFSDVVLGDLYVEKIVGKKALVRIGAAVANGNTRQMLGFVPCAHLKTEQPKDAD